MQNEQVITEPLVVERTLQAPIGKVWHAITDVTEMRKWYFDLKDFKPEVGFKFNFTAGNEGKEFLHLCEVTEVVSGRSITYSWRYDGFEGNSFVTFALEPIDANTTTLTISHAGLETFPKQEDFARKNFNQGWSYFGDAIKKYVEGNS